MSEIPEVFAIFEQKLAHVLSFNLRQKGQKKAIEELLVYFSGIVERASKAESRIAELEESDKHWAGNVKVCMQLIERYESDIAELEGKFDQLTARWRQERQDDKWIPEVQE